MVALGKKTVLYDLQPTSLCTIQVRLKVLPPENLLHKVHMFFIMRSFSSSGFIYLVLFKNVQIINKYLLLKLNSIFLRHRLTLADLTMMFRSFDLTSSYVPCNHQILYQWLKNVP